MYVKITALCGIVLASVSACSGQGHPDSAPACHVQAGSNPVASPSHGTRDLPVPFLVAGTDVTGAYRKLHRLGFIVEFTKPADIWSLGPGNVTENPPAGILLRPGSIVEITPIGGPLGSPAVDKSHPHFRVPNFTGCTLSQAVGWVNKRALYWSVPKLPSPRDNSVSELFDGYRIVTQKPTAGAMLGQGVMHGRAYHPTPLTLTVVSSNG